MYQPGPLGGGSFWVSAGLEVIILLSLLGSIVENRLLQNANKPTYSSRDTCARQKRKCVSGF